MKKRSYFAPVALLLPVVADVIRTSDPYEGEFDPLSLLKRTQA